MTEPDTEVAEVESRQGRAWVDRANGVRIGYRCLQPAEGCDRTVMLIHGAPQTGYAWRKVAEPLSRAGYRVIVPDYRGAGTSTKPADGYDKWTMARDLHHLIHQELGLNGPISLVGHDLGSMVATAYALQFRHDAVSLVTMEAPIPGTSYFEERKVARSAWHFDFHAQTDIAVYLTQGRERWYITRFYDDLSHRPDAITGADRDVYTRAFEAPGAMRALFEIYRELEHDAQLNRTDIAARGKLTIPVLASGGAAQTLASNYRPMCEEFAHNVMGELVPGSGHWVPEENPDYFIRMFLEFDAGVRTVTLNQPDGDPDRGRGPTR